MDLAVYEIAFLFMNTLLILSSLLYIPIMIDVKKFSYLPMALKTKPHRYIFWQTIVVLVLKSISLSIDLIGYCAGTPLSTIIIFTMTMDLMVTPLIIQVSYLGCNKRNLDSLMETFEVGKLIRSILNIRGNSAVAPESVSETRNGGT